MGLPLTKIYSIQPFKVKSSLPFRIEDYYIHKVLVYDDQLHGPTQEFQVCVHFEGRL